MLATLALLLVILAGQGGTPTTRPVPRCQEDAVLIGVGSFDAGRWTGYQCGPSVDDYSGEW